MKYTGLLCIFFFILGSIAEKAPFIIPCHLEDSECILNSARKAAPYVVAGVPELGVPPGDPFNVNDINADTEDLKLKLKNVKMEGASKCKLVKMERNRKKSSLTAVINCPILLIGQYTLGGKISFIDAQGEGAFEIKSENILISMEAIWTPYEKDGKKHYKISSFEYTYEPTKRIYFKFDNLFNGDQKKAEPILTILNESWKELTNSIGTPIVKEILNGGIFVVNKLFEAVPSEELEIA